MSLLTAQNTFQNLINSLSMNDRNRFLSWVNEAYQQDETDTFCKIRTIAEHLKTLLPADATHTSEKINYLPFKKHEDEIVFHVDSFLYEEEDIDALEIDGHFSRSYCSQCKTAKFIRPTTFVSHSMSIPRLKILFQNVLPDLSGKTIVDIGSRLGAILYGAYYYSAANRIIGVEINEELCRLQNLMIQEYDMKDRIQILCDNILNVLPILKTANVVVLNNVFQCFMSKAEEIKIWNKIKQTVTNHGTLLITVPSIEESSSYLEIPPISSNWLKQIPLQELEADLNDDEFLLKTFLYEVI